MTSIFGICAHSFHYDVDKARDVRKDPLEEYKLGGIIINTVKYNQRKPPPIPVMKRGQALDKQLEKQHLLILVNIEKKFIVAARHFDADKVLDKLHKACVYGARRGFILEIGKQTMANALVASKVTPIEFHVSKEAAEGIAEINDVIKALPMPENNKRWLKKGAESAVNDLLGMYYRHTASP